MNRKLKTLLLTLAVSSLVGSVALANQKPVYEVEDGYNIASRVSYEYHDGSLYRVNTQIGYATDIALHSGETFQNIVAGDTRQWSVDKAKVGDTYHVYIKPLVKDVTTDMVINTDRRSYRLLVTSTDTYTPLITFDFIEEMYRDLANTVVYRDKAEKEFLDIFTEEKNGTVVVKKMNYKYKTKSSGNDMDKELCPVKVFDDGVRTYIEMPNNRYDLPVLYNVDDSASDKKKALSLVNYRVKGKYYIADRVFNHARLQYTTKLFVDISPKKEGDN